MKWPIACCVLLLSLGSSCFSQQLDYAIIWKDDSIGYVKVMRTLTDSSEYHNFEGASKFRVLFSFTTGYLCEAFFENGMLTRSIVTDKMNESVRGSSTVEWTKDKYQIVIDGESKVWGKPITATVGSLYYTEPNGLTEIFSERHGRFLEIEKESEGRYRLKKPDDRFNTYQYENGVCTKVEVDNMLTSFSFHLVR